MRPLDKPLGWAPMMVRYSPAVPRSDADLHPGVDLQQVEFLVTERVMDQNIATEDLARLILATETCLRQSLSNSPKSFGLRVRFTIYPNRPVGIDLGTNVPTAPAELQAS